MVAAAALTLHFRAQWAAFSVLSGLYAFFVVPELKGRSLEELDYVRPSSPSLWSAVLS